MSDFFSLISRILLSAVFIAYGWIKFANVDSILGNPGTKKFMELVAGGAAPPTWLGYLIAAIELLGGIAILLGIKTRWVAWAFVVYVIIATGLAHEFWTMEGPARGANQANFYKNLAIIGGYLLLAIHGGGRISIDGAQKTA